MRRMSDITIEIDDRPGLRRRPAAAAKRGPGETRRRLKTGSWRRPVLLALALTGGAILVGFPVWLLRSAPGQHLQDAVRQEVMQLSARAGFKVEEVFVEGRSRTPRDAMLAKLGIRRGDPIFGIDLSAARRHVEEISWVKSATIERRLPNEVHVLITERAPVMLWQNDGRYYLIDRDGQMVGDEIEEYADLPLTVGEGAPDHAGELMDLLKAEPLLAPRVKAAQWVGGRRWSIVLDHAPGGIEVMLPESDPQGAWHELAKLDREQSLLERRVAVVDMRLPDRLVLRTAGSETPASAPVVQGRKKPQPGKDA